MKKTVILILAILPIVLLVVIAFAGQILSIYQNIPVEKVEFVDRIGSAYTEDILFKVPQGGEKETKIRIYPELASNKRVSYTSSDENICTVDENGVIHGKHYGMATIVVKTDDGSRTAMLSVQVTADIPYSVELSREEAALKVGQKLTLDCVVDAPVAIDKTVSFTSSDTSVVTVTPVTGGVMITAVGEGEAIVTVTTRSGGLTDACTVRVEEGKPPVAFELEGVDGLTLVNEKDQIWLVGVSELDLKALVHLEEGINPDELRLIITSGSGATIENGVISFTSVGMITVRAYIDNPEYSELIDEVIFVYDP
ncbi:MAG: Ig-like domain-containing protein [Clostridia bacterium]|nr:Ig-like domain-containing protein [Clostridia bacterium]